MPELTKIEIVEAVKEAIDGHLKDFYIEREKHWEQHKFVESVMVGADRAKQTAVKTIIGTF